MARIEGKTERIEEENMYLRRKNEELNQDMAKVEIGRAESQLRLSLESDKKKEQESKMEKLEERITELLRNEQLLINRATTTDIYGSTEKAACFGEKEIEEIREKGKPSLYIRPKRGETMAQLKSSWVSTINPETNKIRASIYTGKTVMVVRAETKEDVEKNN